MKCIIKYKLLVIILFLFIGESSYGENFEDEDYSGKHIESGDAYDNDIAVIEKRHREQEIMDIVWGIFIVFCLTAWIPCAYYDCKGDDIGM